MLADKGHTAPCLDCAAQCCEHGSHWRRVAWRGVFFLVCSMPFGFQIFTMDPVAAVASGMMDDLGLGRGSFDDFDATHFGQPFELDKPS